MNPVTQLWLIVGASLAAAIVIVSGIQFQVIRAEQASPPLPPSRFDQRIAALDREAVDAAYKEKIKQLFDGWIRDSTAQPQRALTGADSARRAYIAAMTEIERREAELAGR